MRSLLNTSTAVFDQIVSVVTIEDTENQATNPTVYPITRDAVGDGIIVCNEVYYRDNLSGDVPEGCTSLTAAEFRNKANFTGFDFDDVWLMGKDYPELRAVIKKIKTEFLRFRSRLEGRLR